VTVAEDVARNEGGAALVARWWQICMSRSYKAEWNLSNTSQIDNIYGSAEFER
jgi:hypothetical protein